MKFRFVLLIFTGESGLPTAETEFAQEFVDSTELAIAMTRFAASQSGVRGRYKVMDVYRKEGPCLRLPDPCKKYGPEAFFVIKEVTAL